MTSERITQITDELAAANVADNCHCHAEFAQFNHVVDVVISGSWMHFDYLLNWENDGNDGFTGKSFCGLEVEVELGRRKVRGWIVARKDRSETNLARIKPVLSFRPAFSDQQLSLFRWVSEYYGASLGEVIESAVPARGQSRLINYYKLSAQGLLASKNEDTLARLGARSPNSPKLIQILAKAESPLSGADLETICGPCTSTISSLVKKQLVSRTKDTEETELCLNLSGDNPPTIPPQLNTAQENALNGIRQALKQQSFKPFLLFGVTGSGKTEVYLRAIQEVLQSGGSALVIVPEISLTPQLHETFARRLNTPLAMLHSGVGTTSRWNAWEACLNGRIRVAIGARSAIFAPLTNLKLIIVDEEHDSSYKQNESLRYNARDVAVMRARIEDIPVILGSATPSFETMTNVQRKKYSILSLPERATSHPLPSIKVVDLRSYKRKDMISENISPPLYEHLKATLESGEQAVILYNRRGFSSFLQCKTCGDVIHCPSCSVTLTFHRQANRLLCHCCGFSMTPPELCGLCRDPKTSFVESDRDSKIGELQYRGAGTESIVEEIANLFPQARLLRMDRDTVGKKGAYEEILGTMKSKKADILLGTQMIAKGHDIPGVTLVGIIDADIGLHIPDFRASERAYQLITQASGRAGRGAIAGKVILQTREPNHPTIVAAVTNRFMAFARFELEQRQTLNYPPWSRLARIIVSHPTQSVAWDYAGKLRNFVDKTKEGWENETSHNSKLKLQVLGPSVAPYEKIRNRYRFHLLIKSSSSSAISSIASMLDNWKRKTRKDRELRITVDVDPVDLL
ncbi:MAG: primosomal protein N' [bacterium]|nr:primosomal protein N' [bacterium]